MQWNRLKINAESRKRKLSSNVPLWFQFRHRVEEFHIALDGLELVLKDYIQKEVNFKTFTKFNFCLRDFWGNFMNNIIYFITDTFYFLCFTNSYYCIFGYQYLYQYHASKLNSLFLFSLKQY